MLYNIERDFLRKYIATVNIFCNEPYLKWICHADFENCFSKTKQTAYRTDLKRKRQSCIYYPLNESPQLFI